MDHDIREAKRLLRLHREAVTADQSSICLRLRPPPEDVYSYTEVNHVLAEVVDRNGSASLVQALLALGGDINFARRRSTRIWDKVTGRDQYEERSGTLQQAARRSRADIVHALANYADQVTLDQALHDAIARSDLAVLKALLVHGADPVELHDDFESVVIMNRVDMMKMLLEGPKIPCLSCRSSGLRIAVKNKAPEAMHLLLNSGADVNHDNAAALLAAVDYWRPDFVAILLSGPVSALSHSLDLAVGKAHEKMDGRDNEEGMAMVDMCLSAGGAGPETSRVLTKGVADAVRQNQLQLLDTLLKFAKPSGQYEAMALLEAIKAKQKETLVKLLALNPSPQSLTVSVMQAIKIDDITLRYEMAQLLVGAGAQGPCVAEALVEVVKWVIVGQEYYGGIDEEMDKQLFTLLLEDGDADIDHKRGQALQLAVKAACTEVTGQIIAKRPSPDSLGTALPLAMAIQDMDQKQTLVEMLLRNAILDDAVNKALVESVKGGPDNRRLTELILTRADVNYNNGEVFIFAIRNSDMDTLRQLMSQGVSYKALFTATMEALKIPKESRPTVIEELVSRLQLDHLNLALKYVALETYPDTALTRTLLQAGAEATLENGVCIKHAACNLHVESLRSFAEFSGHQETIFTQALTGVISRGRQWIAYEHLELVQLLLCHGASGDVVNRAMVDVVDQLAGSRGQTHLAEKILNTLIASGADVNYEGGKVVGIAAGSGDAALLAQLLGQGATTETATFAFSTAIMAHHEESQLLKLIDVFVDETTTTPDVTRPLPGMLPPLFLCLNHYGSVELLDCLWKLGCDLESTVPCQVYPDERGPQRQSQSSFGMEPVTALMWAVIQPDKKIGAHIFQALIDRNANVSYMAPMTRATPLILAAKYGRFDIVQLLIQAGAKQPAKDVFHRSALFYASRSGNENVVSLLLKGKPGKNDGSLHEASRCFHPRIIQMLIDAGHDVDYRSSKHGGRTALGEMALLGYLPYDVSLAEEAAEMLKDAGANPLIQVHGKSVIFLALDNQDPVPVTRLLLEKILWKSLNEEACIYHEADCHYSPSMYVAKGIARSPPSESPALISLLKDHGATDRYYAAMEHEQPVDAVGLPIHIQDYENMRRARERRLQLEEEEHSITLRREAEQVQHRVRLADLQHDTVIRHGDGLSAQKIRHRGLEHNQEVQIESEKHHNQANIAISEANVRSRIGWQAHRDAVDMRAEVRAADLEYGAQLRAADLEHARQAQVQRVNERVEGWGLEDQRREQRHLQDLEHKQQSDHQEYWSTINKNRAQLSFNQAQNWDKMETQRQIQWHERQNLTAQDQIAAGRDMRNHRMKMLELETERGNMIGKVNLEEWGQWKNGQGHVVNQGPQRKLLT